MPADLQTTGHTLANRFRLGVSLAAVIACLLGVGLLLKNRWQIAWDEAGQVGTGGQHKRTNRALTTVSEAHPQPSTKVASTRSVTANLPVVSEAAIQPEVQIATPVVALPQLEPGPVAAGAADVAGTGSIVGRVVLVGTPPAEVPITITDPNCGKSGAGEPLMTQFYKVGPDGGLADVFVYLSAGVPAGEYALPPEPLLLDQLGCWFTPYVSGAQVGQTILVRNSDKTLHNVHWVPTSEAADMQVPAKRIAAEVKRGGGKRPIIGHAESNLAQLPGSPNLAYIFTRPEVFLRVKCDVHPWMFAYVGLVEHPFFAVTDTNGVFSINNVPPGRYVVQAVHRKTHPNGKGFTAEVVVEADAETPVFFKVDLGNSTPTASR